MLTYEGIEVWLAVAKFQSLGSSTTHHAKVVAVQLPEEQKTFVNLTDGSTVDTLNGRHHRYLESLVVFIVENAAPLFHR